MNITLQELHSTNIKVAKRFALEHEADIVPAVEEIKNVERGGERQGVVYIIAINYRIAIAILYISDTDTVSLYWHAKYNEYVIGAIEQNSVVKGRLATAHAITGRSEVVECLSRIIARNSFNRVKRIDYLLMTIERGSAPEWRAEVRDESIRVEKGTRRHIFRILPLHAAYLREEVRTAQTQRVNYRYTLGYLHDSLARHTYYIVLHKMRAVAKANSNAEGYHCAQLGGIFTSQEYRKQGIGYTCLTALCADLLSRYRMLTLFVKNENATAISLYKRIGFRIRGSYATHYMP